MGPDPGELPRAGAPRGLRPDPTGGRTVGRFSVNCGITSPASSRVIFCGVPATACHLGLPAVPPRTAMPLAHPSVATGRLPLSNRPPAGTGDHDPRLQSRKVQR